MSRLPFSIIVEEVATDFGMTAAQIVGQRRNSGIIVARYVAIRIAADLGYSQTEISKHLRRDPSTIGAAERAFARKAAVDPALARRAKMLRTRVLRVADREAELAAASDAADQLMTSFRKRIDLAIRRDPGAVLRRLMDVFGEPKAAGKESL